MAIIILSNRPTENQFQTARQDYQTYIKMTADIVKGVVALGGEYQADAERLLLDRGSQQSDIWGGGLNLETKQFETDAIVNLRPGRNQSTEILDPTTREQFLTLAKKYFKHMSNNDPAGAWRNCYADLKRAAVSLYLAPSGRTHLIFLRHAQKILKARADRRSIKFLSQLAAVERDLRLKDDQSQPVINLADRLLTIGLLLKR